MRKYWVLVGLLFVAGFLFAQNRANYDKNYYEPIKLKHFKTHPNTFVPEEVELEPDLEPAPKANTETTKPVLTKKDDKKAVVNQEVIVSQKEQEAKTDIKSEHTGNNSTSFEKIVAKFKSQEEKIEKEEPKNPFTFLPKGKSKAFKITPVEGVTISAEENALDKDREFTMKVLPEKQIDDFGDKLNKERKETGCVISAWELHAGMADNEVLEGSFKMEFDLEKLGVLPEFYENVACYRIDEKGNWFEYVITHSGNKVILESRQNSCILLTIGDFVSLGYDESTKEFKFFSGEEDDDNVTELEDLYKIINKKTKEVVWKINYDDINDIFESKNGNIEFSSTAINDLGQLLIARYEEIKSSLTIYDKVNEDYKKNKDSYCGSDYKTVMRQLRDKYTMEALKKDKLFLDKAKKLEKSYKNFVLVAKKVQSCCQMACDYYYDVIFENNENNKNTFGIKPVPYCVNIRIVNKRIVKSICWLFNLEFSNGAETPTNFWGTLPEIKIPYGAIQKIAQAQYDNLTLTICHEMFHVIQRNCYSKYRCCLKWDEATAQYFEDDALQWFKDKGKMNENTKNLDCNADYLEYYTVPFNNDMGYVEGKYYQYSFDNKASLGYPLSHFLRYLNEKKIKEEKGYSDKRWHGFNNCYSWYQSYPEFTTLLNDTFGINDKKATEYYIDFAKDYSNKFYERIRSDRIYNLKPGFTHPPYLLVGAKEIGKNGQRVVLEDEKYTIRLRELHTYSPKNYFDNKNRKIALQVVLDQNFKQIMPDRDFQPTGSDKSAETKRGYFYFPINPNENGKKSFDNNFEIINDYAVNNFYILEIDGGTDVAHRRIMDQGNLYKASAGYTIWTMYAPELEENPFDFETVEEIVEGEKKSVEKVRLQLPKKSEADELGKCIDGYWVKIQIDKGEKIEKYFEIDKIKDQKVFFDYEELRPKDLEENEPVTGTVIIAEYVLGKDGEKLNGPESEEVKFVLDNNFIIEMVKCPAGSFVMGSSLLEPRVIAVEDQEIQHKVTISKPFYIGKYEITQEQYKKVMGKNPSYFKCASAPVENIDWEEAEKFCEVLNTKYAYTIPEKGYKYALPTEAQWEYACRAGTTTALNSGKEITLDKDIQKYLEIAKSVKDIDSTQALIQLNNFKGLLENLEKLKCSNLDEVAWYKYNSKRKTHPVGQKKPNAWGIYDMHGNVGEWCADWSYKYTKDAVTDPVGKKEAINNKIYRNVRGGNFMEIAINCRSGFRAVYDLDNPFGRKGAGVGFRVVLIQIEN